MSNLQWKDVPDAPGLWVLDFGSDFKPLVIRIPDLSAKFVRGWDIRKVESGRRWLGPLPEDKREEG